uniref:HTH_Tnp_Tc3_2 domain-containing protein n=1 Tax=Caenorhabditis japonica TaxID=281687 RepID=A0A8R1DJM1_CAEJA
MAIIRGLQMGLDMPTLAKQFKTSKSVICETLNTPNLSKATGRLLKTLSGDDRIIVTMSKKNPRLTSKDINSELKDQYGVQVSKDTVKRRLRHALLFRRRPVNKPMIPEKNRSARLKHVTTLALSLCHIRISANQWIELLSRMTVKHLYVDFCTFDPSLFSDKVMMPLEHLETLQIQPRFPCFLNDTSDQTLIYWATRGTVPPTVLLRNGCASRITPDGIRMLITSALASQSSAKLDWDFGLLLGTTQFDAALLTFILYPGWQVKVSDDFRSRKIQVQKESTVTQFSLPVPFPMGSLSVPLN